MDLVCFIGDTSVYLYMLVMFETLYHLTNMVQAFGHGTETWRMKELVVQKKVLEMMGRTIPCKYHEKCVLGRPPHGISWQFSICRCSQNTARFKNPLHAPAENVHFVRGLEALCYQILGHNSEIMLSFFEFIFARACGNFIVMSRYGSFFGVYPH